VSGWHWVNVDKHRLRVRHYFDENGNCLCGKVKMNFDPPRYEIRDEDPFNCRACRNKLRRLQLQEEYDELPEDTGEGYI
jgi:hypothetical protein